MVIASATSAGVTMQGGTTWIRFSTTKGSRPRATSSLFTRPITRASTGARVARSATSSTAQKTPVPRTSPMTSCFSASLSSAGPRWSRPIVAAFSTMPSAAIASSVATIEAIASG